MLDQHLKILIVDDDFNLASTLRDILEMEYHNTALAWDAQTALTLCHSDIFDLGIIDIKLPDMSGVKLIDNLAKLNPNMEYIIITGYASTDTAIEAVKHKNVVAYEVKPLNIDHVLALIKQVDERRRVEEVLRESEERYRTLFESAAEGILVMDIGLQKLIYVNPSISEMLGYSIEELEGMKTSDLYLNYSSDHVFSGIYAQASTRKTSLQNLPFVRKDGTILFTDINIAKATINNTECNIAFINDITERKLAEQQHQQDTEKLLTAMQETIQALAMTVEIRDPCTAGHQQRVSQLACTLAEKMRCKKEIIKGIRVAGTLHDIGKMNVPIDILTKTGRLTEIEFDMIRTHAKVGYDILQTIDFPWPVAQVVFQHHERMNGSGYPQGLSGENILLEARILAVADVVEAITSHRPYRPALGIDKALEEISQNGGTLYDTEVVDACLKLFTESQFEFEPGSQVNVKQPVRDRLAI